VRRFDGRDRRSDETSKVRPTDDENETGGSPRPLTQGSSARDVALQFGHQDGGELVRTLYGHPDASLARERVREAFKQPPPLPVPLAASA